MMPLDGQELIYTVFKQYIAKGVKMQRVALSNDRAIYLDADSSFLIIAEVPNSELQLAMFTEDLIEAIETHKEIYVQLPVYYELMQYMHTYTSLDKNKIIYYDYTIREDEQFSNLIKYKKDDGIGIYNFSDGDHVYGSGVFFGMLKVNKADKLGLEIFSTDDPRIFITHYIQKRNGYIYHTYTRQYNFYSL